MKPQHSKAMIGAAAVLTAALVWFAPSETEGQAPAKAARVPAGTAPRAKAQALAQTQTQTQTQTQAAPQHAAEASAEQGLPDLQQRASLVANGSTQLFAKSSWVAPPPPARPAAPPPPPAPPAPPTAPPLPFAFMGTFEQGDTRLLILSRGNRVLTVAAGDVLENTYKVERIEASKVTFTYLPLGTSQTLATGGSQ